jgi:hypothetical protein
LLPLLALLVSYVFEMKNSRRKESTRPYQADIRFLIQKFYVKTFKYH